MTNYLWQSSWAFLLIPILVLVFLINLWFAKSKSTSLQFSNLKIIKDIPQSIRARLAWLPMLILSIGLFFVILAGARPQLSDERVKRFSEGIDIMLTLDISDSMMIEDMDPMSRIDAAKRVLIEFVKDRPSDRIGLVAFKGEAFSRVPMTLDHEILIKNIKSLDPVNRNIRDGTAIGSALALSVARIKDSTARSRVIILATDGENNMGMIDPESALEIAKGFGLRIYTIGIGKDGESMLPIHGQDAFGRNVKRYQPIHSSVNDTLLKKMATDTGGEYYKADSANKLRKVFENIDKLEKSKVETQTYVKYEEHFQKFLKLGIALIFFSLFLGHTVLRKGP